MTWVLWLCIINPLTYALYWWDKRAATWNERRIPEATLLMAGLMGGSVAAFIAQRVLRHKNRKTSFQLKFWVIVIIQIYVVVAYFNPPITP